MSLLETYKALADESRLRLTRILSKGYFNVQELTTALGTSQSTISHHLKTLQAAGFTKNHKQGTWVYYSLNNESESPIPGMVLSNFLEVLDADGSDPLSTTLREDDQKVDQILNRRRDQSRTFFDSVAKDWKELRASATSGDEYLSRVVGSIPQNSSLLELGCGSGALLEKILPREGNTIGVDYSQAMIDEAKRNLGRNSSKVDLRLGYLEHLPLGDESVEVVVACMVLHHIAAPVEALRDAHRVLKPGGRLIVADLVEHQNEYMRERFADLWLGFDLKEFKSWLKDAGFENTEIAFFGKDKEVFVLNTYKKETD